MKEITDHNETTTNRQWYCLKILEPVDNSYRCDLNKEEIFHPSKCHRSFIYFMLLYCNFCMGMCYSLQAPFFPKEAEKKGVSSTEYGWIIGISSITIAVIAPLSAKLITYVPLTMLCCGSVFICAWCIILFGFLEAASSCIFFTSSSSLIADIFPKSRTLLISVMETVYGVSMMLGPGLGGPLYEVGGYFLPFVVSGGCTLIGFIFCFATIRSLDPEVSTISGNISALIFDFNFITLLIVAGSSYISLGFNTATLEPHVRQFHLSPTMVSIFFITYSFMYSVSSLFWGWLSDKKGYQQYLITCGIILSLFGYLLIGPVPFVPFKETMYSVIIAQILLGVGSACQLFCSFSYMFKYVIERGFPDDIVTSTMIVGATVCSLSIGEFIGPVLGGFLLDHMDYHKATLYVTGIHLAVGLVFLSGITWKLLQDKKQMSKEETFCLTSS